MPKADSKVDRQRAALEQAWVEFQESFKRSSKGNLWRHFEGMTLVVFKRQGDGLFSWSISDSDGPRFSAEPCDTEEDAMLGLWDELGLSGLVG